MLAPRASMPARSASTTASRRSRAAWHGQAPGGTQRVDPRAEQGLVGVDVPHARDAALVEQERLDRRRRARARAPRRCSAREPLVERLHADARGEERVDRRGAEQQLAGAEAARVDDHEPAPHAPSSGAPPASPSAAGGRADELQADTRVRGLGNRLTQHRARHAQVLGEMDIVLRSSTAGTCPAVTGARCDAR